MNRLRMIRLLTDVLRDARDGVALVDEEMPALAELWTVLHEVHVQLTQEAQGGVR